MRLWIFRELLDGRYKFSAIIQMDMKLGKCKLREKDKI
jgi:hypothetical protein